MRARFLLGLALALAIGCSETKRVGPPAPPLPPAPTPPVTSIAPSVTSSRAPDNAEAGSADLVGPGFPEDGPWVSFYGSAAQMGDLARVARTFRVINIDADPSESNFTDAQIKTLKAGGKNRVLSYLNIGSCEKTRAHWSSAPAGFVSCGANTAAQRGAYDGYPDEVWMDPGNADYARLVVEHVAARLAARGVDGFYLDNLEILEHSATAKNGACNRACKQGGLDLVRALREKYPTLLLVMQNATGEVTRTGMTGGRPFPTFLDGIAHEEIYRPKPDREAEEQLLRWQSMHLRTKSGRPLWIAVEDYVGGCANHADAALVFASCQKRGFSAYVSDESAGQKVVCFWDG